MTLQVKRGRDGGWIKVIEQPERWERPGFGVIVARSPRLWAFLPICGHDYYPAFSLENAQAQAEARSGLCTVCWQLGVTGTSKLQNSASTMLPTAHDLTRDAVRTP